MNSGKSGSDDSLVEGGGRIPGMRGQSAFRLHRAWRTPIPVVIAVPHAGRTYPPELLRAMRCSGEAVLRLEDRLVDLVGEAVAAATGATLLVAHAPRAMIDLNRATDDVDWDMVAGTVPAPSTRFVPGRRSRTGLGLVPRRLQGVGELWNQRLPAADLAARIDQVHAPYHRALDAALTHLRDRWGTALLLDLHSMPPLGPKSGPARGADYVIGDRFGAACDSRLVRIGLAHLERAGQQAALNRPYAGGYVLDRHGRPQRGIHALQLEVCRATYLDRQLREPGPGMGEVVRIVTELVRTMAGELSSRAPGLNLAAE